jgi:hypothetical protein
MDATVVSPSLPILDGNVKSCLPAQRHYQGSQSTRLPCPILPAPVRGPEVAQAS